MALRGALMDNSDKADSDVPTNNGFERQASIKSGEGITCSACGKLVTVGSKFCFSCGAPLADSEKSTGDSDNKAFHEEVFVEKGEVKQTSHNNVLNRKPIPHKTVSNAGNTIAESRKKIGIGIIILGLMIAVLGGGLASSLSKSYEPIDIMHGYRDPNTGELEIYDTGKIGGNYEAVSYYNSMMVYLVFGGFVISCTGAGLYASGKKYEKTRSIKKQGQVIGVDAFGASIEFDDGSRTRIPYLANVVFVSGEKGIFEIKENTIIGFEKQLRFGEKNEGLS